MPPYSHVLSIYERLSVLSAAAIKREVRAIVATTSKSTTVAGGLPSAPPAPLREACALLVQSGEWQRAFLVAASLPQAQGESLLAALDLSKMDKNVRQVEGSAHTSTSWNQRDNQSGFGSHCSNEDVTDEEMQEMSLEALLRLGFAIRSPVSTTPRESSTFTVHNDIATLQRRLFVELRRRARYKELAQCVMNWKARGLLPPARGVEKKVPLQPSESTRVATLNNATSTDTSATMNRAHGSENEPPFSSLREEKLTFNSNSISPLFHAEEALYDLLFDASNRTILAEAMREFPGLLISTLNEPSAAVQFVRKAGPADAMKFVLHLMSSEGRDTRVGRCGAAWDTIAALLTALRPHVTRATSAEKAALLHALLHALRGEGRQSQKESNDRGDMILSARRGSISRDGSAQASMRTAATALCVGIAQRHDAAVRFVGLPLFTSVALALCECGAGVPSALVQCIFLCLGDAQRGEALPISSSASGPNASSTPCASSPFSSGHATTVPSALDPVGGASCLPERDVLRAILAASPMERWSGALQLLELCHTRDVRDHAGPAHLRTLLGGLHSISIPRTWPVALRVADLLMERYRIFPDETGMGRLMLNLHAASWMRAFDVLALYERQHITPPVSILRDLQVVATKHGTWETVLRLMTEIQAAGPPYAGFMSHVYCLRAYGCAGKWSEAIAHFKELKNVPRAFGGSVYNATTVAVPILAMMEHKNWDGVVAFTHAVRRTCGDALTQEGWLVSLAAEMLAMLHRGDAMALADCCHPHTHETPNAGADTARWMPEMATLGAVVAKAAQLQTMLGMEHLHAPIRLVLDVLAVEEDIAEGDNAELIGRSHTRGANKRPRLYIPPRHMQEQLRWFAVSFGQLVRREEQRFGSAAQQEVAEAMHKMGVGAEYLTSALL